MCTGKTFLVTNTRRTCRKSERKKCLNFPLSPSCSFLFHFAFYTQNFCYRKIKLSVTHLKSDRIRWNFWVVHYTKYSSRKTVPQYYLFVYQSYFKYSGNLITLDLFIMLWCIRQKIDSIWSYMGDFGWNEEELICCFNNM